MKKARNLFAVVLCLALVGAMIAGCGGGGSKSSGGNGNGTGGGTATLKLELNVGLELTALRALVSGGTHKGFTFGLISSNHDENVNDGIIFEPNTKTYDGVTYTGRAKLGSASATERGITFSAITGDILTVLAMSSSSSGTGRNLMVAPVIEGVPGTGVSLGEVPTSNLGAFTYVIPADGDYVIYSSRDGINIYYIKVVGYDGTVKPTPTATTEPTPTATTEPTPTPTPTPTDPLYVFTGYSDNFNNVNDNLFDTSYKTLVSDPSKSMYYCTGGASNISIVNVSTDPVDKAIKIGSGARFTIGQTVQEKDTTAVGVYPNGEFDLSKPYKISFKVVDVVGDGTKKFQVYVDNNSTSAGNSYHGGSTTSRIYSENLSSHTVGSTVEIPSSVGTTRSFIQLRVESSSGYITIDDLVIEYQ